MWSYIYVSNGQNKQALYIYNFFRVIHSFPKTGAENMKVYYIIPLNYRLARHSENSKPNFTIFKKIKCSV